MTLSCHLNLMVDFMVVKVLFGDNIILSRPFMRMARVALSTYHLVLKFPIEEGVGKVRGNQIIARECYFAVVRGKQNLEKIFTVSLD